MATRSGLAMAPGGPRVRLHDEHQSGRPLGRRARPHALGCEDGAQGRRATGADPERDVLAGDHQVPSPEAALIRPGGLMRRRTRAQWKVVTRWTAPATTVPFPNDLAYWRA